MDCFNPTSIFLLVVIVELVLSAPYSKTEYEDACVKVRKEMEEYTGEKREEKFVEKVAEARCEKIDEIRKQGALEEQKGREIEYAALIVVRCQIEYLEHTLFPYRLYRNPRSRIERWWIILTTKGADREMFRELMLSEYQEAFPDKDDLALIDLYATSMQAIYSDMSEAQKGPHNNVDAVILYKVHELFTKVLTEDSNGQDKEFALVARRYISLFGLNYEQRYIRAMKIVSSTVSFVGESVKRGATDPSELSCILITPELRQTTLPKNIKETDVNAFFPPNERPRNVIINRGNERSVKPAPIETGNGKPIRLEWADQIIAEFQDCHSALSAFDKRQRWLKNQEVQVQLIPCPADKSSSSKRSSTSL